MLTGQKEGGICRIAMNVDHVELKSPTEFFSIYRMQIEIWTTSPPCQHCQRSFWKQNLWPWNVFEEKFTGDSRSSVLRRTFCKVFPDTLTVDWVFARWKGVRQKDKILDRSKSSGRVFGGKTSSAKVLKKNGLGANLLNSFIGLMQALDGWLFQTTDHRKDRMLKRPKSRSFFLQILLQKFGG